MKSNLNFKKETKNSFDYQFSVDRMVKFAGHPKSAKASPYIVWAVQFPWSLRIRSGFHDFFGPHLYFPHCICIVIIDSI